MRPLRAGLITAMMLSGITAAFALVVALTVPDLRPDFLLLGLGSSGCYFAALLCYQGGRMEIHSRVYLKDKIVNQDRKFGERLTYYPAYVVFEDGTQKEAMFTAHQVQEAMDRASRNPEDADHFESPTFLSRVFGG